MNVTNAVIGCQKLIQSALENAARLRPERDDWIEQERLAVAIIANQWAAAHGVSRRVTVDEVEHVEHMALGHVDYAAKLALYVAELLYPISGGNGGQAT